MPTPSTLVQPLVWMDLEMSGLDTEHDQILEIAVIVSDGSLNTLIDGPELVLHHPDSVLDAMDEWNTEHHGASGLTARVKSSELTTEQAEGVVLDFLKGLGLEPGSAPLAGNSIHQDRAFLRRRMRGLHDFLHYRNVDVSTLKELARRWAPGLLASAPTKVGQHRALEDIRESIAELEHYRQSLGPDWAGNGGSGPA